MDNKLLKSKFKDLYRQFNALYPTTIAYSYKTNYLPYICKTLYNEGAFAEIIPGFEFELAKKLGIKGKNIIVNGPYKPKEELMEMLEYGCHINVDNIEEIKLVSEIATDLGVIVEIGIRINAKIGELPWSKFGFNVETGEADKVIRFIQRLKNVKLVGIHMHIGTDIIDPKLYSDAVGIILQLYDRNKDKIDIKYIDIGGGFASSGAIPINTSSDKKWKVPSTREYANAICKPLNKYFKNKKPRLILEPGRFLVDEAIYLITRVVSVKNIFGVRSLIVDAGVNILPSSYYRNHKIVCEGKGKRRILTDIYGPLCMQADLLEAGVYLPDLKPGDILIIQTCGAYEQSQSMQFIRPRPAVVCVDGNKKFLIRRKERLSDITVADNWGVIK